MTTLREWMSAADYLRTTREDEWQAWVEETATLFGWMHVHFRHMEGNPEGWPDLALYRDGIHHLVELKTERGVVSGCQRRRHQELAAQGFTVQVWRPGMEDAILGILR